MVNLKRCLLGFILSFYLTRMISGLHLRSSLVLRISVSCPARTKGVELMYRDGISGIDDGEDCHAIEIKAWLLQS